LSEERFYKNISVNEYTNRNKPYELYYQYVPFKTININCRRIIVYQVFAINIDSRMDDWYLFYFDLQKGMIRRWSYHDDYIMESYSKFEFSD
jgi:hypothetical protein